MNLILFGFKGTGKTSLGRLIAEKLHCPFFDTDEILVKQYGHDIRSFYKSLGEQGFRKAERNVVLDLRSVQGSVISLGGGAILEDRNQQLLEKIGKLVYLKASFETVWKRVCKGGVPAFVENKTSFRKVYKQRLRLYEKIPRICEVNTDGI